MRLLPSLAQFMLHPCGSWQTLKHASSSFARMVACKTSLRLFVQAAAAIVEPAEGVGSLGAQLQQQGKKLVQKRIFVLWEDKGWYEAVVKQFDGRTNTHRCA